MLKTLFISNYALIDEIKIEFDKGLTIITGETGAGKSILIGALSLILGERANAQAIRDTSQKIVVEAAFDISGFALEPFFEENDIDYDAAECILRREVNMNGRSRAFINDMPVPLSTLKELATSLVDIHSQHGNMMLTSPAFQIKILDSIAHSQSLLEEYNDAYLAMKAVGHELMIAKESLAKSRSEEDYIRFQLDQLRNLQLNAEEDEELETKRNRLANISSIKEQLWLIQSLLDSESSPVLDSLKQIGAKMTALEPMLSEVNGMADRVASAAIDLKDIAVTLSSLQDSIVDDPKELERVEERLDAIYGLERKHNVDSVSALLDLQKSFESQLESLEYGESHIEELEQQYSSHRNCAQKLAEQLSSKRKEAAQYFSKQLKEQAALLGLNNLSFLVDFKQVELNPNGCDDVEFLMAFNKNQLPMPVRDTASGGEISRVMLCVKSIVAKSMNLPTMIFDEVDAGVSGNIASLIGEMMGEMARSIQVISITHLPQVASHGDSHFKVFKTDLKDSTLTGVKLLDKEEHVMELARMLGGRELDEAAIENAKSLIRQNDKS